MIKTTTTTKIGIEVKLPPVSFWQYMIVRAWKCELIKKKNLTHLFK
jgi:hypothetical protein